MCVMRQEQPPGKGPRQRIPVRQGMAVQGHRLRDRHAELAQELHKNVPEVALAAQEPADADLGPARAWEDPAVPGARDVRPARVQLRHDHLARECAGAKARGMS